MADPTVPWGIPLFDDNTPFAPIQAPFNSQSAALNDALSDGAFAPYATKALMDAAPGTRVGQHATVYADGTVARNGDYSWNGTGWSVAHDANTLATWGAWTTATNAAPIIMSGQASGITSPGGTLTHTFATAFPNRVHGVILMPHQNSNYAPGSLPVLVEGLVTKTSFQSIWGSRGSAQVYCPFIAFGS